MQVPPSVSTGSRNAVVWQVPTNMTIKMNHSGMRCSLAREKKLISQWKFSQIWTIISYMCLFLKMNMHINNWYAYCYMNCVYWCCVRSQSCLHKTQTCALRLLMLCVIHLSDRMTARCLHRESLLTRWPIDLCSSCFLVITLPVFSFLNRITKNY